MIKWISLLIIGIAVISAALSSVSVMNSREAIARAAAAKAESLEEAAKDAARKAQSEEKTAIANENAEKAKAAAAAENRKAKEAEQEAARLADAKAQKDLKAAKELRQAKDAEAAAAADLRAAEKLKTDAAKEEAQRQRAIADQEAAKAQIAETKQEQARLAAEMLANETKLWELKSQDLASLERELAEYKKELDERELALRPEKTIKDLANLGSEEEEPKEGALLPEDNPELSEAERKLAKALRLRKEQEDLRNQVSREITISKLERLWVQAIRDRRPSAAEYYRAALKSMYPDWKYKPENTQQQSTAL